MKYYCYFLCIFSLSAGIARASQPIITFEMPGVHVRDYALGADGDELYVTIESIGKDASQIIRMQKEKSEWTEPKIASFSGQFKDLEPFLHPNGLQLFFASNRNNEQTESTSQFDIWKVERTAINSPWGFPEKLSEVINTPDGNEFYPSVASNGNLYFTATKNQGMGKEDIYVSRYKDGSYSIPELLPESINSESYEFNGFINPDENMFIYSSYGRKDGTGGGDLYISHFKNGEWLAAENLGIKINSNQLDYCPFYDAKNKTLYWTSNHSNLSELDFKKRNFNQWYKLFTNGSNGASKIYKMKIDLIEVQ